MSKSDLVYNGFSFTALTYRGSVIGHVLPKTIFFTLWTLLWVCIQRYGRVNLSTFQSLIALMTLVLSLLLVFRTNTAYDRYWEGRRLWSTMQANLRSMANLIWVHMAEVDKEKDRSAKHKVIKLMIAYPYAVKRYLRGEYGTHHDDIAELISHIPRYATPSSLEPMVSDLPDKINDPKIPLQPIKSHESDKIGRKSDDIPTNLPLEIAFYLSTFIANIARQNKIGVPVNTVLINNVNGIIDCLSGFERILRTPIPTAYSVHLNQLIWIFCLTLPFQLFNKFTPASSLDWVTIPIVAVTVFTSFGIINIGEEIDDYCKQMKLELEAMVKLSPPDLKSWTLAHPNTSPTFQHNVNNLGGVGFVSGEASGADGDDGKGLVPQHPLTSNLDDTPDNLSIDFGLNEGNSENSSLNSKSSVTPLMPTYQSNR